MRNIPTFLTEQNLHVEKLRKGTPLSGLSLLNNVHVHPQLKNTLRPPGHKLISIELLTYRLDLKGNSTESQLISTEILTYSLDLTGKSIENKLISIEILSYPLDLTGNSIESK